MQYASLVQEDSRAVRNNLPSWATRQRMTAGVCFQNNMASKTKLGDLDLSRDEIKRLGEALKDEKFREMLREYAEEISDPENRRRYEEEIAQMERERGMDVTFIRPEPGYVLKTSVNGDQKAFINISKSDKIDKPNAERQRNKDGKSGLMWHIPHSFAPPKEDYDKQKKRCQVYDFVVHPDTYRMAESNVRFKQLVEDTAMDGIEKQFGVTLDRKNVKRPKLKFKGVPAATVIRNRSESEPQPAPDASGLLKDMPYPYENKTTCEMMQEREAALARDQEKKKGKETPGNKSSHGSEGGPAVPKYTMIHRTEVDMQEYRNAPDAKPSTRPRELVIKIELPLLKTAAQANLDIYEKRLQLESTAPAAYKLDLSLPYPVDDSEGSAKFDKQKRTLTVTLPVIPDKSSLMPTFVNGTPSADEEEEHIDGKPLIEVLSNGTDADDAAPQQNGTSEETDGTFTTSGVDNKQTFTPLISYTLPDFSFTQDNETVSFVLKVKNVTEDSIKKTSPSTNEMKLVCVSRGEGGFPLHFSLFLRFAEICQVVPEHCSVDITADNVVLLLLKERKSRGLWDRFWAGLDADSLEEHLFLTTNNLQLQLAELDEAAVAVEQKATSPDPAVVDATDCPPCELEVTAMDEKRLTIKISPSRQNGGKKLTEEEEDDEYDPPSSAEIKVVHTHPNPSLQSILKQRTVSESSEDFNPDPESPRSPVNDEDELSSSQSSSGKRRSVSFSEHIDKATFKSSASVSSMKTSLKSKRKRQRKWEEKKDKVSSRRRYNSTGSEGSGDDSIHSLSDSRSVSEEDLAAEDEEKGQGDQREDGQGAQAKLKTVLDFRTNPPEGIPPGSGDSGLSGTDSGPSDELRKSSKEEENGVDDVTGPSKEAADVDKAADDGDSNVDVHPAPEKSEGSSRKEGSLATKIKAKLAETTPKDRPDDSDDEDEGKVEETGSSSPGASNPSEAVNNEHRTECAFGFSNVVMFDLDDE